MFAIFFLRDFISQKKYKPENQKKDDKIFHGRGNSLRNKVRGWVELDSHDPLNPRENTERIALLNSCS